MLSSIVGLQSTFLQPRHDLIGPDPAAPTVTQQWLPDAQARRRLLLPVSRARCYSPPFLVAAAPSAPAFVPASSTRRRGLALRSRRAAAVPVPTAVVVSPPAFVPVSNQRRWHLLPRLRSEVAVPVLQTVATAPIQLQLRWRPTLLPWRRQRSQGAPSQAIQAPWIPQAPHRRLLVPARRARVAQPVPAPPVQGVQAFIAWGSRPLRRFWPPQRRGRTAERWPQAAAVAPPPLPPASTRARRWWAPAHRPRSMDRPWPQAAPALPLQPSRRRTALLSWHRRSGTSIAPVAQAQPCPLQALRHRPVAIPMRRGRSIQRPWPQVIPVPPPRELGRRRPPRLLPLWPRRAHSTFRIPFQNPTPLRNIELFLGQPQSAWTAVKLASGWAIGRPVSVWSVRRPVQGWSTGQPESEEW